MKEFGASAPFVSQHGTFIRERTSGSTNLLKILQNCVTGNVIFYMIDCAMILGIHDIYVRL